MKNNVENGNKYMEMSSSKDLVESKSVFEKILNELGLEMKSDSWLYFAYNLVEELTDLYKDEARLNEFKKNKSKNGEASMALYDLSILNEILPHITSENKDILEIMKQLQEDCPDFYGLEGLSPNLAEQISFWIKEDRMHTIKRTIKNIKRVYKRRESLNKIRGK